VRLVFDDSRKKNIGKGSAAPIKCISKMSRKALLFLLLLASPVVVLGHCDLRELPSTSGHQPMSADGGFYLTISGNPEHYEPGSLYTVSLRVSDGGQLLGCKHLSYT
jgi:hypothetical protein